jgi:hypothetical protein
MVAAVDISNNQNIHFNVLNYQLNY